MKTEFKFIISLLSLLLVFVLFAITYSFAGETVVETNPKWFSYSLGVSFASLFFAVMYYGFNINKTPN